MSIPFFSCFCMLLFKAYHAFIAINMTSSDVYGVIVWQTGPLIKDNYFKLTFSKYVDSDVNYLERLGIYYLFLIK